MAEQNEETFIQAENKTRQDQKVKTNNSVSAIIFRSSSARGLTIISVFAIVVPVLVYYFVFDKEILDNDHSCLVNESYRIRCGNTYDVSLGYCDSISCCYDNRTKLCFHYLPSKYYYLKGNNDFGRSLTLTPYKKNMTTNMDVSFHEINENVLKIILHNDEAKSETITTDVKNYNYSLSKQLFIDVYRKENNELLLTTAKGPTIFSEDYWEWSFQLTDQFLFGLGELLIHSEITATVTKVIYGNKLDHTTLPVFMAYENGKYHGLVVRHSGPLEVTVLPSKLVSLKGLTGSQIELELSLGPTPREVVQQQRGMTDFDQELWTLGVHLCREGSSSDLADMLKEYEYKTDRDFETESDCFHENLLMGLYNNNSQTDLQLLNDAINNFPDRTHFMMSLPPQIPVNSSIYNETQELNVFYKKTERDYEGQYLGTTVVYPYFGHENISLFLEHLINSTAHKLVDRNFPAEIVFSQNWPSDDSANMLNSSDFQYLSQDLIEAMSYTIPWNVTSGGKHMEHHTDYGALQVEKLSAILNISNVKFSMTAAHNFDTLRSLVIQDVDISWVNFKDAIVKTLYNSVFVHPLVSIPVCGSTSNFSSSHESLCVRWYMMASTSPIFRISSALPRRDPNSLTSNTAVNAAKSAIKIRYSLQYYYYTTLRIQGILVRPLFYDFYNDEQTFNLTEQYMVGADLLVAHPTLPDKSQISIYLPESADVWYEFGSGDTYDQNIRKNGWIILPIVETDWIAFIKHGAIIPLAEVSKSSDNVTINVRLKVALKCSDDTACSANGTLITESEQFLFSSNEKNITIRKQGIPNDSKISETVHLIQIVIFQPRKPSCFMDTDTRFTSSENEVMLDYTNVACTGTFTR